MHENHELQAGFARVCVTPAVGAQMEGFQSHQGAESIHDDLFVRVLALESEGREVVIVGCDLLFFEREQVDRFHEALGEAAGLAPAQVLINTSHTHAGPRLTHWAYSAGPDADYVTRVETAIVEAVLAARARRVPVTLEAGVTRTSLPVNRRLPDAAGRAQWAPYPEGAICDALPFCLFRGLDGRLVSLVFSVSCHPSMIGTHDITAEYPGAAMRLLNDRLETEGAMFLQGAGGDAKPRQVAGPDAWRRATWEQMEQAGAEVAEAVRAALPAAQPYAPDLAAALVETLWPLAPRPTCAELQALATDPETPPDRRAWADEMLSRLELPAGLPGEVPVRLHAVRLARGVRLLGVEGELVADLGNHLIAQFPGGVTFPLGYTDGTQAYLPSSRMLPEGGYEVDSYWEYHQPAPFAPGMEEVLSTAVTQLRGEGVLD